MGIDAGFDLFPPLSTVEDMKNWQIFFKFVEKLCTESSRGISLSEDKIPDFIKTAIVNKYVTFSLNST
jgi:hypothetical protein